MIDIAYALIGVVTEVTGNDIRTFREATGFPVIRMQNVDPKKFILTAVVRGDQLDQPGTATDVEVSLADIAKSPDKHRFWRRKVEEVEKSLRQVQGV